MHTISNFTDSDTWLKIFGEHSVKEFKLQESKEYSVCCWFNKRITVNPCQACPLSQEISLCYITNSVLFFVERLRKSELHARERKKWTLLKKQLLLAKLLYFKHPCSSRNIIQICTAWHNHSSSIWPKNLNWFILRTF